MKESGDALSFSFFSSFTLHSIFSSVFHLQHCCQSAFFNHRMDRRNELMSREKDLQKRQEQMMHLIEEHKKEKEKLLKKIHDLERELEAKQRLELEIELEIERLKGTL
ncbi:hypothetical protein P8452_58088 [Trifolium repens]|nr:hypothetical protein P8452_58088 [Trifolium repens]